MFVDTEILFEALQEGDSLIRDADTAKVGPF